MEVTSNDGVTTHEVSVNEEMITPAEETQQEEQQLGTPTGTTQPTDTTQQQGSTQQSLDQANNADDVLEKDLTSKGVDFKAIEDEYLQNGALSEETQQRLAQAGYPKEIIDNYIRNVEREANAFVSTVKGFVGGDQEWDTFVSFVQSQGDNAITLMNDAINTGNLAIVEATVGHLKTQMVNTYGTNNPTLMSGGSATGSVQEGFASSYEMQQAMSDVRYGRDRAYTQMVEQKVINSNFDY
nr:MAG TPA: capsid assembly protein [Caudoviricetes sp.]